MKIPLSCRPEISVLCSVCFLLLSLSPVDGMAGSETVSNHRFHLEWEATFHLPTPLSGHFTGVHNGVLVIGGGTNFPVSLFKGGRKEWYGQIYAREPGSARWKSAGVLPHPLAYCSVVSTNFGVVCMGGSDGSRHYREVFLFRWTGRDLHSEPLPDLPAPRAYGGAAAVGSTVYFLGGRETPDADRAEKGFWSLDLAEPSAGWNELPPWPGPPRILPVVCAQSDALYLFSGADLVRSETGTVSRRYLTDGYRFTPGGGWERVAETPVPTVAAPAVAFGPAHVFVFGGDDGSLVDRIRELRDDHPGFSKKSYAYHTLTDTWTDAGKLPIGFVTTQAVLHQDRILIPGGEDRPGHRGEIVLAGRVVQTHEGFSDLDYGMVVLYLGFLVGMGFYFSRREKSTEDFFLAGRRIPWWAAGLSIFGTQLSAITYLAIPAKSFAADWLYFLVNMTIILVAPVVVFFYLPFYRRLRITTVYEYLEKRFNLAARWFGSLSFLFFQLGRMGIVLFLPALALSAATGVNIYVCILLMGTLSTAYTVLGGIEAVIWTDVAQVVVLVGGAVISLFLIVGHVDGGWAGMIEHAWREDKFHALNWGWDAALPVVWVVILGQLCANAVPYTSDQTVVQRYLTTTDEKGARRAIWTNAAMTFPATLLFCAVGTALYEFYRTHPGHLDPSLNTDAVFPHFIVQELPSGVAGLVVAGIFAASMSSLDSSMNSLATVVMTDFFERGRNRPYTGEAGRLRAARLLTLLFGVFGTTVALVMASFPVRSFMDLYINILGFIGGSLTGLFTLGIFTRKATGKGAVLGAAAGVFAVPVVRFFYPIHFFLNATLGIAVCFTVGYIASGILREAQKDLDGLTVFTFMK